MVRIDLDTGSPTSTAHLVPSQLLARPTGKRTIPFLPPVFTPLFTSVPARPSGATPSPPEGEIGGEGGAAVGADLGAERLKTHPPYGHLLKN